jgi:hypothetical protein
MMVILAALACEYATSPAANPIESMRGFAVRLDMYKRELQCGGV